jgi:hypothetical protein
MLAVYGCGWVGARLWWRLGKEKRVGFGSVSSPRTWRKPDAVRSCASAAAGMADRKPTSTREFAGGVLTDTSQVAGLSFAGFGVGLDQNALKVSVEEMMSHDTSTESADRKVVRALRHSSEESGQAMSPR